MILFVNESGEIQDVNTTEKSGLTTLVISDENNPFDGWSVAKICCYRVEVTDGQVVMFTPYVDSRIVEQLDRVGTSAESTSVQVTDTQTAITDMFEMAMASEAKVDEGLAQIEETQLAITELYELLTM